MGSHGLPITPHEVQESEHDGAKAAERDAGGATTGDEGAWAHAAIVRHG